MKKPLLLLVIALISGQHLPRASAQIPGGTSWAGFVIPHSIADPNGDGINIFGLKTGTKKKRKRKKSSRKNKHLKTLFWNRLKARRKRSSCPERSALAQQKMASRAKSIVPKLPLLVRRREKKSSAR